MEPTNGYKGVDFIWVVSGQRYGKTVVLYG